MNDIYKILIELGFFGLVATAYYFWQRKRILSRDRADIYNSLLEMIIDMEKELAKNLSASLEFKDFVMNLKSFNEEANYPKLAQLLKEAPSDIPDVFSDSFADYHTQIKFHIKD
jgi:hypothetical protein